MRKIFCLFIAFVLSLALSGCTTVYTTSPVDQGLRRVQLPQLKSYASFDVFRL